MVDIPEFGDSDFNTSGSVSDRAKGLIPWLPDPLECHDCGGYCTATQTYDPMMCEYTNSWECPNDECGNVYYREGY